MFTARNLLVRKGLDNQKAPRDVSVDELRSRMERIARLFPPPDDFIVNRLTIAGVPCSEFIPPRAQHKLVAAADSSANGKELVRGQGSARDDGSLCDGGSARDDSGVFVRQGEQLPCVLYFHGGGYVSGSSASHSQLIAGLARAVGGRVLSVDYRLAPEHPFPAAVDDALAVYRALVRKSHSADISLAVVGDSAGAGLVLALLMSSRDNGLPLPAAAVCFSGWFDCAATGESVTSRAAVDPILYPETLTRLAYFYLGEHDRRLPLASPLYGNFGGLPPLLLQVGSDEILLDDSVRLAAAIEAAGGQVAIDIGDGLWHVYQFMARLLPEGAAAIERAGAFITDRLGRTSRG